MKCVLAYRNNKTLRLWFYLFCFFGTIDVLVLNEVIDLSLIGIQPDIYLPAAIGLIVLPLFGFLRRAFIPSVRMEYDTEGIFIYTITKKTKFVRFNEIKYTKCGPFPDGQVTIGLFNGKREVVTCVGKRKAVLEELNDALKNYAIAQKKKKEKEEQKRAADIMKAYAVEDAYGWNAGNTRGGVK